MHPVREQPAKCQKWTSLLFQTIDSFGVRIVEFEIIQALWSKHSMHNLNFVFLRDVIWCPHCRI